MSKKNGLQIAGGLAHHAKALYHIIRAFLQGGWAAAALQALRHYWPQILTVALILTLLPLIIYCCLPMMLFGYESAYDSEVMAMTEEATAVSALYDRYDEFCQQRIEAILQEVYQPADDAVSNTEISPGTSEEPSPVLPTVYETQVSGTKIQKQQFVVLHAVYVENDLYAATEENLRQFIDQCIVYSVSEPLSNGDETAPPTCILHIRYRTPEEVMEACGYTEEDRNWVQLLYTTMEENT